MPINYEDKITEKYGFAIRRPQAAEILTISIPTLDRLVKDQEIKVKKVGHSVVFTPKALAEYLGL